MSVIGSYPRHSLERKTESEIKVKPSSSKLNHDYQIIIETTCLFFGIVLVLMMLGPVMISSTSGLSMDEISACRLKIIGFEQVGYYSSPEQFRAAESLCYLS